jgi:hypothetical protein
VLLLYHVSPSLGAPKDARAHAIGLNIYENDMPAAPASSANTRRAEYVVTHRVPRPEIKGLSENDLREALEQLDPIWDELFLAEQARIVRLLVERVDVGVDGLDVHLRPQGLTRTFRELAGMTSTGREAA